MIDLHSHILPGVDDGAPTVAVSLAMARMAVADGIQVIAATPHFMPGLYDNEIHNIHQRVADLNRLFQQEGINLSVILGGDVHIRPDLLHSLRNGIVPTLHGSRYFLFEPAHITKPPRMKDLLFNVQVSGFVPILTHPERLKWIEQHYQEVVDLAKDGVWMQITAGSLTGKFGKRPQYWAQKMLSEGLVHIIATDAHNTTSRPPLLAEAFEVAKTEVGLDEATHLVLTRPEMVLDNLPPEAGPALPDVKSKRVAKKSIWRKLFSRS